jgi:hypothetical protein
MSKEEVLPLPAGTKEQSWRDGIIRAGFVRRGYISEMPGLHPELRFIYLPMMPETTDDFEDRVARAKSPGAGTATIGREVASRLRVWSFDEEINEKTVRSLGYALLNRLRLIISGRGATDLDPLWERPADEDYESIEEQLGKS